MQHKKTRVRKGVRQALFGGYVWRKGGYYKEVRVWALASLQEDDCGPDTNTIVELIAKKAKCDQNKVSECWRY
ncbi:hypothetical protein C4565_00780 [Candidatus Parcubacteria bacterium]|nr:MAG: hypothetical protein C4565_00780 [Candidatus Parcubacteria bacterium]